MAKDILLDEDGDLLIANGDFAVGESEMQEVESILKTVMGDLKEDPLLGANLLHYEKSTMTAEEIKQKASIALQRDEKDFNTIKAGLTLNVSKK